MSPRAELLQGSLLLLILKTLDLEPLHGWAISKRIRQHSNDVLQVNQGSLYPALYRLRDRGFIESEWKSNAGGRPVKVYRLTRKGRAALAAEQEQWQLFSDAVGSVLARS